MSRFLKAGVLLGSVVAGAMAPSCRHMPADGGDAYDAELSQLRGATERFASSEVAAVAGYNVRITGCMADPVLGGMGFHIGNPDLINGTVELERPEVMLYEPVAGDLPRLVAVEYVVPFEAWTASTPPVLMGQTFKRNEGFGLWALHVWLYKENPTGIFSDWNPRVSCAAAPPEASPATATTSGRRSPASYTRLPASRAAGIASS